MNEPFGISELLGAAAQSDGAIVKAAYEAWCKPRMASMVQDHPSDAFSAGYDAAIAALRQQSPRTPDDADMALAVEWLLTLPRSKHTATLEEAACAYDPSHVGGFTAKSEPANRTAMPEGDMHRALEWMCDRHAPGSYLDAIEEAVAAYDPARVGADTVCRTAMPEVTEAMIDAARAAFFDVAEPKDAFTGHAPMRAAIVAAIAAYDPAKAAGEGNHKLDTDTHVFFYEQDFYVLSNFSAFTLYWDERENMRFDTSEAAYHWEKFHGHEDIQSEIINAPSAHEAFKIAERNKRHRRADWDAVKFDVMRNILRAKAAQHEYVRRKLLATGDRTLVEDSWRDDIWGWGPNRDGQNMLGKLWMEIRAELRAVPIVPAGGKEN